MFGRIVQIVAIFTEWIAAKIRGNTDALKALEEERRRLHETLARKNKYIKQLEHKLVENAGPAELSDVLNELFHGNEGPGKPDSN